MTTQITAQCGARRAASDDRDARQPALRRRGLIAGAAALVVGIAAKQTSAPALAAYTLQGDTSNTSTVTTTIKAASTYTDEFLLDLDASQGHGNITAVRGIAHGTGSGVAAISVNNHAIVGNCQASKTGIAGVYGFDGSGTAIGVLATNGVGASGTTAGGVAVQAQGGQVGVVGMVNNAANTIAVFGNNLSAGANGIGVYGSSANGTGVYGQTSVSNQFGVLGTTYATNSTAIAGTCTANDSSAFSGGTTNPNAFAGIFQGTVVVQGKLVVSDPSYKSGALQHPDGSHRLVYCVESPESWIEEVGTGTLINGKATVAFDKEFAAVVHTDTYHVFLTPYDGACKGLGVTARHAEGFVVQELNGGTSSGTFSWKVMVKGKSSVKSERLGKFVMPTLPLPDPAKFKAPATPPAAPPTKP